MSRAVVLALVAACSSGCASRMFYYPSSRVYGSPADAGLQYEEVVFPSRDGTQLTGWFLPAVGKAKGTVVHYHGNAQNMTAHFQFAAWLPAAGYNVFEFDYRGYGRSGGTVTRKGLHSDSLAALDYVRTRKDVDPERLLVFGQSLGGALALAAVADDDQPGVRAVVVDSTFYSYRLIVREKMAVMPLLGLFRWPLSFVVVSNRGSPSSTVGQVAPIPLLILHGTDDRVVPFDHGRLLYEAASEPRTLVAVRGGEHTDAVMGADPRYRVLISDFFDAALTGRKG